MAKQVAAQNAQVEVLPGAGEPAYTAATGAVRAAVDRALSRHQDVALREVEAILDATLRVTERVAPAAPKVADIVAEAKSSNQAFYRYFSSKDELISAVFERGLNRVVTYVEHQVGKHSDPREQLDAWVRGVLAQATNRKAARQSAALAAQLSRSVAEDQNVLTGLRDLLVEPVRALGSADVERDATLLHTAVFGTMQLHIAQGTSPTPQDIDHIIAFSLRGIGAAG